jgi:hypothetical protein
MLSVVRLNSIMLNVIMLSAVMLNVIMLGGMTPCSVYRHSVFTSQKFYRPDLLKNVQIIDADYFSAAKIETDNFSKFSMHRLKSGNTVLSDGKEWISIVRNEVTWT